MAQRQAPNLKDAQNIVRQRLSVYAKELPKLRAVVGRSGGSVEVDNPDKAKQGYVYVRVRGDDKALWEVLNFQGSLVWNTPVIIQLYDEENNIWAIKEVDRAFFAKTGGFEGRANLAAHAPSHAWPDGNPGEDPINVYARNIVPLRAFAIPGQGLTIFVAPARVPDAVGGVQIYQGGQTTIPGGSLPAAGQIRFVLISLDLSDLSLTQTLGDPTADGPAVVPPIPDVPADEVPSCLVLLKNGDTDLDETRFADYRLFVSSPVAAKVFQLWESDFGNVAAEAGAGGDVTFHQNIILDGIAKRIIGAGTNLPDLGHASDATKKWGDIYFGSGVQVHATGDITFTATDAWNLKSTPGTWLKFDGAAGAHAILPQNTTLPNLGSATAAERFGSLFMGSGKKLDYTGSINIQGEAGGNIIFNDDQLNVDFLVETDNEPNTLFIQGSTGFVGIGTTPTAKFNLVETYTDSSPHTAVRTDQTWSPATTSGNVFPTAFDLRPTYASTHSPTASSFLTSFRLFSTISSSGVLNVRAIDILSTNSGAGTVAAIDDIFIRPAVNSGGGAITQYRALVIGATTVAGTNYGIFQQGAGMINRFSGKVAIGGSTDPTAQLRVDQSNASASISPILIRQNDVSEQIIEFDTTIGTGNAIEAVGAKTLTPTHFVKVKIPGGLIRHFEVGTIA